MVERLAGDGGVDVQQPKLRIVFPQTLLLNLLESPNWLLLDTGTGPHCWVQLISEKIHLLPETIKPLSPGLECVLP